MSYVMARLNAVSPFWFNEQVDLVEYSPLHPIRMLVCVAQGGGLMKTRALYVLRRVSSP
jgi:hypothetical protein